MLKRLMITTALSGLIIGGAVAQSTQQGPTMQGVEQAEKAAQSSPSGQATGGMKFINAQGTDQWLSSSFIGTDVVGPDNEKLGDVSDILFDKNGNVIGYVVGVGGFLGIGAKNVALAPSSFQVMPAAAATTGTGATAAASGDDIKLKLNMTKDQIKQAASFESKREQEAKTRAASQPAPGSGMNRPQSR